MTQKTAIEWTDSSCNPVRFKRKSDGKTGWACTKVAAGCKFCYAEAMNLRFGTQLPYNVQSIDKVDAFIDFKALAQLYKLEPQKIFMFNMTDVFGDFIPATYLAMTWMVMLDLPQHTFQILTKRPEKALLWSKIFARARESRLYEYELEQAKMYTKVYGALNNHKAEYAWANHLWLGVSIATRDDLHNLDLLRACSAKYKFVSFEPLLEDLGKVDLHGINWVITGGESGPNRRPFDEKWALGILAEADKLEIPFFHKQGSGFKPGQNDMLNGLRYKEFPVVYRDCFVEEPT